MKTPYPFKQLPDEVAMDAYRWMLNIGKKGTIKEKAKKHGELTLENWEKIRTTIRVDPYYIRLWKPFAALWIKNCDWCLYHIRNKCYQQPCKFKATKAKIIPLFGINKQEFEFIISNLKNVDIKKFKKFLKNIKCIIQLENEEKEYEKRFKDIYSFLTGTGNFTSKERKGFFLDKHFGIDKSEIKSVMLEQLSYLIRRYDYLKMDKFRPVCTTSLTHRFNSLVSEQMAEKRQTNFKDTQKQGGNHETITDIDSIASDQIDPENLLINKTLQNLASKVILGADGALKQSVEVLLGKENKEFISFLREKSVVKTKAGWSSFYNKINPAELMLLVNEFSGEDIQGKLTDMLYQKTQKPNEGEKTMSKVTEIPVPKKDCCRCEVFIDYLKGVKDKKKRPRYRASKYDCSPAFPGCPAGKFIVVRRFDMEAAAQQLASFITEGDDDAIKECIAKSGDAATLLLKAKNIVDADESDAIDDDNDNDDSMDNDNDNDDGKIDLDAMGKSELVNLCMSNKILIEGIMEMEEEEIREMIREHVDTDNDDEEDVDVIDDEDAENDDDDADASDDDNDNNDNDNDDDDEDGDKVAVKSEIKPTEDA